MSERSERIIVTALALTGAPFRSRRTRHESMVHQ
jgi:hypothetical protein